MRNFSAKTEIKTVLKITAVLIAMWMVASPIKIMADEKVSSESAGSASCRSIESAKDCVVEIISGFTDKDGKEYDLHHGSGFVIAKDTADTYIATAYSLITTDEEVRKYCNDNSIAYEQTPTIFNDVIISGDVRTETEVHDNMVSQQKNFCILTTGPLENKEAASVSDMDENQIGNTVWSMGYALYDNQDGLGVANGVIENSSADVEDVSYIQVTARTSEAGSGGPLVSDQGYVLGMMDYKRSSNDTYCALPITDIAEILDSMQIGYESEKKESAVANLKTKVADYSRLLNSGKYRTDSMAQLEEAIDDANELLDKDSITMPEVIAATKALDKGYSALEKKTPVMKMMIRALPGIVLLLVVILIWQIVIFRRLAVGRYSNRKREKKKSVSDDLVKQKMKEDIPARTGDQRKIESVTDDMVEDDEATVSWYTTIEAKLILPDGNQFVLNGDNRVVSLGRKHGLNDVILGEYASRKHAQIFLKDNTHYIRIVPQTDQETGSVTPPKNGTYVNDVPVNIGQAVQLNDGDELKLGSDIIIYRVIRY